jgi:hypothetical protein
VSAKGEYRAKWLAIYGASVALQVRELFAEGRNPPTDADMERIIEEAEAVADLAERVEMRLVEQHAARGRGPGFNWLAEQSRKLAQAGKMPDDSNVLVGAEPRKSVRTHCYTHALDCRGDCHDMAAEPTCDGVWGDPYHTHGRGEGEVCHPGAVCTKDCPEWKDQQVLGSPPCPSAECPMCNGTVCQKCGAGCWDSNPSKPCEHGSLERHEDPEP